MADLSTGADAVGGERFGNCEYNDIKNHFRDTYGEDPCSASGTELDEAQPGMIISNETDDRLYHVILASGCGCSEILQDCVPLSDDKYWGVGDDFDGMTGYDELINDAWMFGIPVSPKRGLIFCDVADIGGDFTGLITAHTQPTVFWSDLDIDSYLAIGHSADDKPDIYSNNALNLQYEAINDVVFFGNSGAGENRYVYIYGWETGRGARNYTRFQMSDTNNEFIIESENNEDHEGITISLTETNQRFRIRQNSDILSWYLDGTDAFMKWSDGQLEFQTDETDASTIMRIKPNGTSETSQVNFFDADDIRLQIYTEADRAQIESINGALGINRSAAQDIHMFESAASDETPELKIYGFRAADVRRSLEIGVGVDAADTASFDGVSNFYFDGNFGIGTTVFGTNAAHVLGLVNATAPTTSPADISQMWSADVLGVAGKAGPHQRSEEGGMYAWHGGAGTINSFTYQADVADDGSFTLPAITDAAWGFIQAGANEEYALFTIDDDGDVTLISNSANVVANADTDGKLCLGILSPEEPLTVKNALGTQKNINLIIWYN